MTAGGNAHLILQEVSARRLRLAPTVWDAARHAAVSFRRAMRRAEVRPLRTAGAEIWGRELSRGCRLSLTLCRRARNDRRQGSS